MESEAAAQPPIGRQPATGVNVLTAVAGALAKNGGPPGSRLVYRMNPKGEHVVAVIWPPEPS